MPVGGRLEHQPPAAQASTSTARARGRCGVHRKYQSEVQHRQRGHRRHQRQLSRNTLHACSTRTTQSTKRPVPCFNLHGRKRHAPNACNPTKDTQSNKCLVPHANLRGCERHAPNAYHQRQDLRGMTRVQWHMNSIQK